MQSNCQGTRPLLRTNTCTVQGTSCRTKHAGDTALPRPSHTSQCSCNSPHMAQRMSMLRSCSPRAPNSSAQTRAQSDTQCGSQPCGACTHTRKAAPHDAASPGIQPSPGNPALETQRTRLMRPICMHVQHVCANQYSPEMPRSTGPSQDAAACCSAATAAGSSSLGMACLQQLLGSFLPVITTLLRPAPGGSAALLPAHNHRCTQSKLAVWMRVSMHVTQYHNRSLIAIDQPV